MEHEQQIIKEGTRIKVARVHPETMERLKSAAKGRKGRLGTVMWQQEHFWPHAGDLMVQMDAEDQPVALFSSEVRVLDDAA